jgi:putative FmdB family regulatory protein
MMPTYEYRCTRCNHKFESVHAVGETVDRCERCGGPVRRVFSPPALIFKGSGFHITDYRKTPPPADGDGKAPAASKSAGETKSADSASTGAATSSKSESKKAS